jgi:GTP cyclohydrolase II
LKRSIERFDTLHDDEEIMFAYIDPAVKRELLSKKQLFYLDVEGRPCPSRGTRATPFLSMVGPIALPLRDGKTERTFQWYAWVRNSDLARIEGIVEEIRASGPQHLYSMLSSFMAVNSALIYGNFARARAPLVRVHSNCLTGDVFGSMRCDCGPQLLAATRQIAHAGTGAIIYMAGHEGRGIGLWAKAITYLLQDAGHDTYQANEHLGLPADSRDFSDAARVINYFRGPGSRVRLLANNPIKRKALEEMGIVVVEQVPVVVGVTGYNARYLQAKRHHGHLIEAGALKTRPRKPGRRTRRSAD